MKLKASGKTTPFLRVFFFHHFSRRIMFWEREMMTKTTKCKKTMASKMMVKRKKRNELKYKEEKIYKVIN